MNIIIIILLSTVLGVSLCVLFISFVRVPNLKVTAAVFTALFFYDIFWVRTCSALCFPFAYLTNVSLPRCSFHSTFLDKMLCTVPALQQR